VYIHEHALAASSGPFAAAWRVRTPAAAKKPRAWTQEELATVAGTSVRTIPRIERGEPASVETLRALAQALDVTVDVLRTSAEQCARAAENLKKMEERYRIVRLERIETQFEIRRFP